MSLLSNCLGSCAIRVAHNEAFMNLQCLLCHNSLLLYTSLHLSDSHYAAACLLQTSLTNSVKLMHHFEHHSAADTGGLLQADWCSGVDAKLLILACLCPQPGKVTCVNGKPSTCSPGCGQPPFSCGTGPVSLLSLFRIPEDSGMVYVATLYSQHLLILLSKTLVYWSLFGIRLECL